MRNRILNSLCGVVVCTPFIHLQAGETQPNIIFILVDDFRYDALGYCGNTIVHTPALDCLAEQGVFFRNAFSSTPISSASRASILTGLYERTHRYGFRTGPLDETFLKDAYPLKLKDAGYHTALFGKLGVDCIDITTIFNEIEVYGRNSKIRENGYCYKTLNNDTVHLTRYTGQRGLDFIERQKNNKPFFLALCFNAPHAHDSAKQQYFWDEDQEELYKDIVIPEPIMSEDKYFNRLPEGVKNGFSRLRWKWRFDTPEKYQFMIKGYYRMISGVDQEIAKMRKMLEKKGLDGNTVIVFMGDNGYFLGERQLADKWMMYDLSVRIPLIIYDPRINKHAEIDEQVLNLDLTSTFADLAGADIPSQWQGKSLKGFLINENYDLCRDTILLEHLWEKPDIPSCEGVRTNKWKYFRYVNDRHLEELYNIEKDPNEEFDLSKDSKYAKVLNNFRNKTDELAHRYSANGWIAPQNLSVRFLDKADHSILRDDKMVFGWTLPYFSQAQRCYQILVSADRDNIDCNIGDIWDSGCVFDHNSLDVAYEGRTLKRGTKYYWRVRFWDYLNRTSHYSDVQEFFYGENKPSDRNQYIMPASQTLLKWGISTTTTDDGIAVVIAPNMEGVHKSEIIYPTLAGNIYVEYQMEGNNRRNRILNYVITVPANVCADFVIPKDTKGIVTLNKIPQVFTYGKLRLKAGRSILRIN